MWAWKGDVTFSILERNPGGVGLNPALVAMFRIFITPYDTGCRSRILNKVCAIRLLNLPCARVKDIACMCPIVSIKATYENRQFKVR